MAVKVDKEQLIKHHFWILLGLCVLLVLIALLMLPSSVGSAVEADEKAFKGSKDTLEKIRDVKNEKWVEAYKTADGFVASKRDKVWQEAWELQKDMMTWPPAFGEWKNKYPYFGDRIDILDREAYPREYRSQLYDIVSVVQPVDSGGEGVVQFKGDYNSILGIEQDFAKLPVTSDDIWMAQEHLWLKRELLRVVRDANELVARFHEVSDKPQAQAPAEKGKPAPPAVADNPNHKRYRNPHWELDLELARNKTGESVLRWSLKNITKRQLALGISFKVALQNTPEEPASAFLHLDGEPLAAGKSTPLKEEPLKEQLTIQGLFKVEQVFNWRTGPVKRIDELRLDYLSSRTANRSFVMPRWVGTPESGSAPAVVAASPPAAPGAPPGTSAAAPAASSSPSGSHEKTTQNGLPTDLYTDVGDAVRHMPVGMVVILEEEHIPEFLAAFASSKLRIQTLQYHWHHTREKMAPKIEEQTAGAGGAASRGGQITLGGSTRESKAPPGPPRKSFGMSSGPGGAGRGSSLGTGGKVASLESLFKTGPKGTPQGPAKTPTEAEEEEMSLVELAVYGVASIYERYPPKSTTTQAAAPAGAGGTAKPDTGVK